MIAHVQSVLVYQPGDVLPNRVHLHTVGTVLARATTHKGKSIVQTPSPELFSMADQIFHGCQALGGSLDRESLPRLESRVRIDPQEL